MPLTRGPAALAMLLAALASCATTAAGQRPDTLRGAAADSARRQEQPRRPTARDSLRPPLSPGRAFLYSFALPGLGQARLQRHAAGAVYATVESGVLAMMVKAANDLRIARAHAHDALVDQYKVDANGAPIVGADGKFVPADTVRNRYAGDRRNARRTHFEDWIAALAFTHLFAGADAFVSAQLWDLPAQVGFRSTPGGPGVGVTIRW